MVIDSTMSDRSRWTRQGRNSDGCSESSSCVGRAQPGGSDRLRERCCPDHLDVGITLGRVRRHHHSSQSEPCGLDASSLGLADLAKFAPESHLTEYGEIGAERLVAYRAHHGEADAEVEPRFAELDPAGGGRIHVLIGNGYT